MPIIWSALSCFDEKVDIEGGDVKREYFQQGTSRAEVETSESPQKLQLLLGLIC